jgi:Protein of unknown function DUF72/Domain of unknown function (DUF6766)
MKRLREIADAVARFWEPLEPLRRGRRLGPVLWQLPDSFHRDDDLLASALEEMPPARHCFEFRHPTWFAAPVRELLVEHGASLAIGDDKRRPLPEARPAGKLAYLRLHYGHRGRGGNYSEAELDDWRRRIAAWRSRRPVRLPEQRLEGIRARQRRARGWRAGLYGNSLLIVMALIFLGSWLAQSLTGWSAYNQELTDHGAEQISWAAYLVNADFWQTTLQNWQSEFLAVGSFAAQRIGVPKMEREIGRPQSSSRSSWALSSFST